jgi:hypothetical protein
MSVETTKATKCSRCGTPLETCAFCDEPDCPAITCYRCLSVAFLDRLRSKPTTTSTRR